MSNRVVVGEKVFEYKIGNTFIGVWEVAPVVKGSKPGRLKGVSFVVPYDVAWLDRTRVRALIIEQLGALTERQKQ